MSEKYKKYQHNPPHLFRSNAKYFITGATYKKVPYLNSDKAKEIFLKYLFRSFEYYNWSIEDWVVLDNHYHIMANSPQNAESLSQVINNTHRFSALKIRKICNMECIDYVDASALTHSEHSKLFHNYWDTCITYENSYYSRLNYIWHNPVKHGYVKDSAKWKFGSYYYRINNPDEKLDKIVQNYPCDNINVKDKF